MASLAQQDWRYESLTREELPKNLDAVLNSLVGRYQRRGRVLKELASRAEAVLEAQSRLEGLGSGALRKAVQESRRAIRKHGWTSGPEGTQAMAAACESSKRVLGLQPFPVQIMAALGLLEGNLVEMATGEGKTLCAALAGILFGWTGRPLHIVTANDYLAQRDATEMRALYDHCGLSSSAVTADLSPAGRREAYSHPVCYTTSKELVADFLRDRLRMGSIQDANRRRLLALNRGVAEEARGQVMQGIHTVIVDEADSVMIDEAVTPLIISREGKDPGLQEAFQAAHEVAEELEEATHYRVQQKYREIEFTPRGRRLLEEKRERFPDLWRGGSRSRELIEQVLIARHFYHRGRQYLVQEGKVVIIDEFTGRAMPNRTWRDGLHQAIEIREGVAMTHPAETLSRLSFQRFFRSVRRLSGMTGTAREAAEEFWQIYGLPVVPIPLNRPSRRESWSEKMYVDQDSKLRAMGAEIRQLHRAGRPVLVGLRSVEETEKVSRLLEAEGVPHQVLNAVRHQQEAQIISLAGQEGRVTLATNMAGRGTDIRLGPGVKERGGLHVIAAEKQDSSRIDRQLVGRCGRQGEPGSFRFFLSLEDDLVRRFGPSGLEPGNFSVNAAGEIVAPNLFLPLFERCQQMAEKLSYQQRKAVLRSDFWLEESLGFAGA